MQAGSELARGHEQVICTLPCTGAREVEISRPVYWWHTFQPLIGGSSVSQTLAQMCSTSSLQDVTERRPSLQRGCLRAPKLSYYNLFSLCEWQNGLRPAQGLEPLVVRQRGGTQKGDHNHCACLSACKPFAICHAPVIRPLCRLKRQRRQAAAPAAQEQEMAMRSLAILCNKSEGWNMRDAGFLGLGQRLLSSTLQLQWHLEPFVDSGGGGAAGAQPDKCGEQLGGAPDLATGSGRKATCKPWGCQETAP